MDQQDQSGQHGQPDPVEPTGLNCYIEVDKPTSDDKTYFINFVYNVIYPDMFTINKNRFSTCVFKINKLNKIE